MNELRLRYTQGQNEIFFADNIPKFTVVRKGRRFGATLGAAQAFIENAIDGIKSQLWVDTINGNIDRYYDRLFYPVLKQLTAISWDFNRAKRELRIGNNIIDFRSGDKPENIEGFGYGRIFLNEAGIILKDDYLYTNAILPMLLDYPDSKLIAAGVPKGKFKRDGSKHKFFELYEKAVAGQSGYRALHYTSFDNPFLQKDDIDKMILEMPQAEVRQEIYGEFIEHIGNNPFAFNYKPEKHESEKAIHDPQKAITISIDFNINPFAVTFMHIWRDGAGPHHHQFDEASISPGSIPAMIELIKDGPYGKFIGGCRITGDAMGKNRNISERDNASHYQQLMRGLNLSPAQIVVPPNPSHANSRADVNYVFLYHPDFLINPTKCPRTCYDCRNVQADVYGEKISIIKSDRSDVAQQADFLDCGIRYPVNTFHKDFIRQHKN